MLLNPLEFALMNNPLRRLVQRLIEAKRLRKFSNLPPNRKILEIGCGSGYGSVLINKYFKPKEIHAIDIDPAMIARARKKAVKNITYTVMDAAHLKFKRHTFDAIFDFGIIHHIPQWKTCLKEIKRVLKPGGSLIIEDLSLDTFLTPFGKILKHFLKHPYSSMYTETAFITHLQKLGFTIVAYTRSRVPLRYFTLVARRD